MYNSVIYEIYPLTFNYAAGSKSDPYHGAYGNLKGITAMADYIASLGVDAIWIAPFFKWDKNGFGYDITDYYQVDPMYGTLEDFQELCQEYHKHGIKVFIDQVYNHCSNKNRWFELSEQKVAPYTDYFVWADAKGYHDGKPVVPNNWPSKWDFSGDSAWTWSAKRKQFYMHSFDYTMPNLNINNHEVRAELLNVSKFWWDLGADGFRLDATTHYGCDVNLRNNPLDENGEQMRIYDINSKVGADFLDEMKALANSYPEPKIMLAEYVFDKGDAGNENGIKTVRQSSCDSFFLGALNGSLADFCSKVDMSLSVSTHGQKINWAFSNHDMERATTRIFGSKYNSKQAAMLMHLLLSLPGSICIFQGDELGMPNPADLQQCKNLGIDQRHVWETANMPWDGGRCGFCLNAESHAHMALHPDANQIKFCVENQESDPCSTLNLVREAIRYRKNSIFSENGDVEFINTDYDAGQVIAFVRSNYDESKRLLCIYNFTDHKVAVNYARKHFVGAYSVIIEEL